VDTQVKQNRNTGERPQSKCVVFTMAWGTAGVALLIAVLAGLALLGVKNAMADRITTQVEEQALSAMIPPIDAAAPKVYETATFALG